MRWVKLSKIDPTQRIRGRRVRAWMLWTPFHRHGKDWSALDSTGKWLRWCWMPLKMWVLAKPLFYPEATTKANGDAIHLSVEKLEEREWEKSLITPSIQSNNRALDRRSGKRRSAAATSKNKLSHGWMFKRIAADYQSTAEPPPYCSLENYIQFKPAIRKKCIVVKYMPHSQEMPAKLYFKFELFDRSRVSIPTVLRPRIDR